MKRITQLLGILLAAAVTFVACGRDSGPIAPTVAIAMATSLPGAIVEPTTAGTSGKVAVCHSTGKGDDHILVVAPQAVDAHLQHGDHLVEAEFCDGVDNDCDGITDEDGVCEPCTIGDASQQEIEAAVSEALQGLANPWGDDWPLLVQRGEAQLSCLLRDPASLDLRFATEGAAVTAVNYCGRGNSQTNPWTVPAPTCLNNQCRDHDNCYTRCSVPGSCTFDVPACDEPFFLEGCSPLCVFSNPSFTTHALFICAVAASLSSLNDSCPAFACGACCDATGACDGDAPASCQSPSFYHGDATTCASNPCPVGACCDGLGGCSERTEVACNASGQSYQGDATTCSSRPCIVASGQLLAPPRSSHYEFVIYTVPSNVNGAVVTAKATWGPGWEPNPPGGTSSFPNLVEVPYLGGFGCDFIRNYPQNNFVEFESGMDRTDPNAMKVGSITVGPGKTVAIAGSDCFFGDNLTFGRLMDWTVTLF